MITQQSRTVLANLAIDVAEEGTLAHRPVLEALANVVRPVAPGIAEALIDWDGSEVARLRAFGLAHRSFRHELDENAREDFIMMMRPARSYSLTA